MSILILASITSGREVISQEIYDELPTRLGERGPIILGDSTPSAPVPARR